LHASKRALIRAQGIPEHMRILRIIFGAGDGKAVAKPIQLFGVQRKDTAAQLDEGIHQHAAGGFDPDSNRRRRGARLLADPLHRFVDGHRRMRHRAPSADLSLGIDEAERVRVAPPVHTDKPFKRLRHAISFLARPSREPHRPCTGARSATSHWMSLTVHLVEAHVSARRSRRRARLALSTRWPSSIPIVANDVAVRGSCRSRGRPERVHRSLENAQNAFPTATTDLLFTPFRRRAEATLKWYKGHAAADSPPPIEISSEPN
jgi:hypothetical protein